MISFDKDWWQKNEGLSSYLDRIEKGAKIFKPPSASAMHDLSNRLFIVQWCPHIIGEDVKIIS